MTIPNPRTLISPENSDFSIKKTKWSLFKTFKVLLDFAWELDLEGWSRFFIWKFLSESFLSKFLLIQWIFTVTDFNGVRVVGDTFKWYYLLPLIIFACLILRGGKTILQVFWDGHQQFSIQSQIVITAAVHVLIYGYLEHPQQLWIPPLCNKKVEFLMLDILCVL